MSKEHMIQAMKELFTACGEQMMAHGSCKACPLYDPNAGPFFDEDGEKLEFPKCEAQYPTTWDTFHPELTNKWKASYPKYAYTFVLGDEEFEPGGNTLKETIRTALNDEYNEECFLQTISQGPRKTVLNGDLYVGVIEPLPEILFRKVFQFIELMRLCVAEEIGLSHSPLFMTNREQEIKLADMLTRTFWSWAKGLEDPGFAVRHIHRLEFHYKAVDLGD